MPQIYPFQLWIYVKHLNKAENRGQQLKSVISMIIRVSPGLQNMLDSKNYTIIKQKWKKIQKRNTIQKKTPALKVKHQL